MLKKLIEKFIRRYKNDKFSFDSELPFSFLCSLIFNRTISVVRGWKLLFLFKVPRFLMLGRGVVFRNSAKINLGQSVFLDDFVYLDGLGRGMLSVGDAVTIGAYSRLVISTNYKDLGEYIHIGNNVGIGPFSMIAGSGGSTIGDNTIIGPYFSLHPENHIVGDSDTLVRERGTCRGAIVIGSNCWLGSKVTVLSGVTIGNNSVIGAGSVVKKSIPSNSIAVGVPAKVIKDF